MAKLPINKGTDFIVVDDDIIDLLPPTGWRGGNGQLIKRAYRREGKIIHESLPSRITGIQPGKGHTWIYLDGDWRNHRRDNLSTEPNGRTLREADKKTKDQWRKRADHVSVQHQSAKKHRQGVYTSRSGKKFYARQMQNGKQVSLGVFCNPEDAARAYDVALIVRGKEPVNFSMAELTHTVPLPWMAWWRMLPAKTTPDYSKISIDPAPIREIPDDG